MAYAEDLLELARHLALEPTGARQACLRRAVSTAYYALFHFGGFLGRHQKRAREEKEKSRDSHIHSLCGTAVFRSGPRPGAAITNNHTDCITPPIPVFRRGWDFAGIPYH